MTVCVSRGTDIYAGQRLVLPCSGRRGARIRARAGLLRARLVRARSGVCCEVRNTGQVVAGGVAWSAGAAAGCAGGAASSRERWMPGCRAVRGRPHGGRQGLGRRRWRASASCRVRGGCRDAPPGRSDRGRVPLRDDTKTRTRFCRPAGAPPVGCGCARPQHSYVSRSTHTCPAVLTRVPPYSYVCGRVEHGGFRRGGSCRPGRPSRRRVRRTRWRASMRRRSASRAPGRGCRPGRPRRCR